MTGGVRKRSKQEGKDSLNNVRHNNDGATAPASPSVFYKPTVILVSALCLAAYILLLMRLEVDSQLKRLIFINLVMSLAACWLTMSLIPVCSPYVVRKDICGFDINKKGSPGGTVKIPESMGAVSGVVFFMALSLFLFFYFPPDSEWLVEYLAAMACIIFMLLLGFVDDVVDLPWRVKLLLPSGAALPLLMAYSGSTSILIPKPLRALLGRDLLDLGWIYKLYMGMLTVFCANSINIHAGVNGLEVGQTVVIAVAILIHNIWQVQGFMGSSITSLSPESLDKQQAHAFSIYFMQPLLGTCVGLLAFNWYPSSVFVGDSFTYFAGMALAVVGILGHFSETLLLFFLPQILNFLYSCPQLFKIIPCPRHRLPHFDPKTGLLTGTNDLNLVNLFLRWFGPCTEQQLCIRLLSFQVVACAAGFGVRYILTGWYK